MRRVRSRASMARPSSATTAASSPSPATSPAHAVATPNSAASSAASARRSFSSRKPGWCTFLTFRAPATPRTPVLCCATATCTRVTIPAKLVGIIHGSSACWFDRIFEWRRSGWSRSCAASRQAAEAAGYRAARNCLWLLKAPDFSLLSEFSVGTRWRRDGRVHLGDDTLDTPSDRLDLSIGVARIPLSILKQTVSLFLRLCPSWQKVLPLPDFYSGLGASYPAALLRDFLSGTLTAPVPRVRVP